MAITECPHCGYDGQFYRVTRMSGKGVTQYRFDGEVADNTELHECLSYVEQKKAFCELCHKEIYQLRK